MSKQPPRIRMNLLDKVVATFSPAAGLRRAQARYRLEMVRGYDVARRARKEGRVPRNSGANEHARRDRDTVKAIAREMEANNSYAAAIISTLVRHDIGTGIVATPAGQSRLMNKRVQRAHEEWANSTDCDFEGQHDLYGLQGLARRTMARDGEVLVRFHYSSARPGALPLQLQLLESDYLDATRQTGIEPDDYVVDGVIFTASGKRRGYWMWREHPGETRASVRRESVFIPADEIAHVYLKTRPGQARGISELASSMDRLKLFNDFEDSQTNRMLVESAIFGAFETPFDDNTPPEVFGEIAESLGGYGGELRTEGVGAATLVYLKPGQRLSSFNPTPSSTHVEFSRQLLRGIGAGSAVGYAQVANDPSDANYSSMKAANGEFRRGVSQRQWQSFIPMFCVPEWNAFLKAGALAGLWPAGTWVKPDFSPPAHEPIDPKKDFSADLDKFLSGAMTWAQLVAAQGYDPETQLEQLKYWQDRLREAGVVLPAFDVQVAAASAAPAPDQGQQDAPPAKQGPSQAA